MIRLISSSRIFAFLMLIGAAAFISSCGCEEDCAEFSNLKMCDVQPTAEDGCSSNSNVFAQDATHLSVSVDIKHGEPDDRISVKYFLKDGGSFTEFFSQSKPLKEVDGKADGSERKIRYSVWVSRRADRLWPKGEYKVEMELSQENIPLNATQNFTVQ